MSPSLQIRHILKPTRKPSSDGSISPCPLLPTICKMPPSHSTWVMPDASYLTPTPPPGTVPTPQNSLAPNFMKIREHRQWIEEQLYREACLLAVKFCDSVSLWLHKNSTCVCMACTGVKSRLQIENVHNTHPNTFDRNQCQATCA